jgi:hypothetical protein
MGGQPAACLMMQPNAALFSASVLFGQLRSLGVNPSAHHSRQPLFWGHELVEGSPKSDFTDKKSSFYILHFAFCILH